jgi:hypothetical protein
LIKAGDLKISLSGQNVFTFTGYKGLDPEGTMNSFQNNQYITDVTAGIDGISYPVPRTFSFGLRLSF